jgi:hypothetical protein
VSREVKNIRITVLPKTSLGKWSVGLAAACIVLLVLLVVLVGELGLGVVKPGSLGAIMLGFAFGISGIAALVTGLVSIKKNKERSIIAFLVVVVTVLLTVFGLWMNIAEGGMLCPL